MKQFVSHIDFLIQKHDCVIIPYFGGFVLSHEFASIASDGSILPPRVVVGFNPDLKYNDGLLAESYMNVYSISYDAACKRITDIVNRLNTILSLRQPVQMGNLGKLNLGSDGHLSFTPNPNLTFSYAANYGLFPLKINRLDDIVEIREVAKVASKKRFSYQRIFASIGAAAAAVLVFFVTSTPVLDNNIANTQKSGFFTDILASSPEKKANNSDNITLVDNIESPASIPTESSNGKPKAESVDNVAVNSVAPKVVTRPTSVSTKETPAEVNKATYPMYYVIVGSAVGKSEAQNVLRKIKSQGFKDANIITSPERSRIYVASFDNKNQAERYLVKVKNDNSQFDDAWLYTKRR